MAGEHEAREQQLAEEHERDVAEALQADARKREAMVEEGRVMKQLLGHPRLRDLFLRNYAQMFRFLLERSDAPPEVLLGVVMRLQVLYEMHSQMFGAVVTAAEIIEYMKLNPDVNELDMRGIAHAEGRYVDPMVRAAVENTDDAGALSTFVGPDDED